MKFSGLGRKGFPILGTSSRKTYVSRVGSDQDSMLDVDSTFVSALGGCRHWKKLRGMGIARQVP